MVLHFNLLLYFFLYFGTFLFLVDGPDVPELNVFLVFCVFNGLHEKQRGLKMGASDGAQATFGGIESEIAVD